MPNKEDWRDPYPQVLGELQVHATYCEGGYGFRVAADGRTFNAGKISELYKNDGLDNPHNSAVTNQVKQKLVTSVQQVVKIHRPIKNNAKMLQKREVFELHKKGLSSREIAKKVGLSHMTITRWVK